MAMKIQLHANFPHDIRKPNAAIGYLKSALSEENLDITNIYWYLVPNNLLNLILSTMRNLEGKNIHKSHRGPFFTAYLSRFLYKSEPEIKKTFKQPTVIETILKSSTPPEKLERTARAYKNFIDYSLENKNMANVDMAGFTVKMYQWFTNKYVWSKLKDANPDIAIVVGGLDTREEALAFMELHKEVDFAIWGEGEVPLKELATHYDDRHSLSEVPHLVYRDNGSLLTTDVPSHTLTTRYFADYTDYFERLKEYDLHITPQVPIFGARSCQWNRCKFCSLNKEAVYYERPVQEIVQEIEYQSKKYGVDSFLFLDSDIRRKTQKNFEELLAALLESAARRKRPYDIWAEMSPTRLTRHCVEMMSKIKISVQIGFEALTDALLKKMDKMHGFAENVQALKFGNDYSMKMSGLNVLRNLPGLCEQDILESMKNLEFLRFFLKQQNLRVAELFLYKRARYYKDIPPDEREKRWVIDSLYTEMERLGLIKEDHKWDFFGFGAHNLMYHQLWGQFADLLEKFQSRDIYYSWLEFPDGSSLMRERNQVIGDREYLFDEVETAILKFCDSIKRMQQVKDEFPHEDVETIVSQLREESLLYYDEEKKRLISILSTKALKSM